MWKSKTLSFGGRITLAKAVLGSLPTYFLSLFVAPVGIIDALEKIRRKFVWGGTNEKTCINWVAWEKIVAPKVVGGLGLGSIRAQNLALIAKWWWRFRRDPNSFWASIVRGLHGLGDNLGTVWASKTSNSTWKNIVHL